jgi:hypothetical protein
MYRALQSLILAGLGLAILVQSLDGQILHYLHPRMVFLTLLAGAGCMALAQSLMRDRPGMDTAAAAEVRAPAHLWWLALVLVALLLGQAPHQHDTVVQIDRPRAPLIYSLHGNPAQQGTIVGDDIAGLFPP